MANQLDIDETTVFDNLDERQVEFEGEVDGDEYQFAVQYDVLEALSGEAPDGDAAITFRRFVEVISDAALAAIERAPADGMVLVSENDLA